VRAGERGAARAVWLAIALLGLAVVVTGAVLWLGSGEVRRLFHSPRERARVLWKAGKYDDAIRYFQEVLDEQADDVFALRGMARCYQGKGDLRQAATYAEEAAKHDASPLAEVLRAEIGLRAAGVWERRPGGAKALTDRERHHLEAAAKHAKAALAIDPRHGPAWRALAEATARLGDMAEAVKHAERAIEVDPDSRANRLFAAELFLREDKPEEARRHNRHILDELDARFVPALRQGVEIALAQDRFDEGIELCRRLAALGFDPARIQLDLATCYLGKGQYEKAEAAASKAERKLGSVVVPLLYLVRGTARLHLRKYAGAVVDFKALTFHVQDSAMPHYHLGEAHAGTGEYRLAADAFRQALLREPRLFDARLKLAAILCDEGRLDEALRTLHLGLEAVQDSPGLAVRACRQMVQFCAERGLHEQAEDELRRLLVLDPRSVDLAALLGQLCLERGDGRQALAVAQYAVRLRPRDPTLIHLLARAEALVGNHDVAASRFAQAVRLQPTFRAAYLDWAAMREREGNTTAAEDVYERARQTLGDAPDIKVAYARFLIATKRADEGVAELRSLIAASPQELSARVALVDHLLATGDRDGALAEAKAATEALPGSVPACSLLARVHRLRGEWEAFLVVLTHVVRTLDPDAFLGYQRLAGSVHQGRFHGAVEVGTDALERFPKHRSRIRRDLAVARFLAGEQDAAMQDLTVMLSDVPTDCDAGFLLSLMQLLATGRTTRLPACQQDAVPRGAVEAWGDLARLAERRPEAASRVAKALLKGSVYANAGWHDVAAAQCEAALAVVPENLLALRLAPALLERAGARGDAIAAAERARKAHPEQAAEGELLGDLLLLDGDPARAAEVYSAPVRSDMPPLDLLAKRALLAAARGDEEAAAAAWRAVLDFDPHHVQACNNLAWLLANRPGGDLSEASKLAEAALKLEPDNPAVLDTGGWVHYRAGHDADAIELLAQAVRGAPYRATYHFHLGMAYARQRRTAEARRALLEAIRLDPDADFTHEARQTLAKLGS